MGRLASICTLAAHAAAPPNRSVPGAISLFYLAVLFLLALIPVVALILWLLPPISISLGVVGTWILVGILAAALLEVGYRALFG